MQLSCSTHRCDGVTLVELAVHGGDCRRQVRVENRLDGPVWPPRRHGEPLPGWDEDGVTATVAPDAVAALGYATPARPADPPAEIAAATAVDDAGEEGLSPDATAATVLGELGDFRPPRDAVAPPGCGPRDDATERARQPQQMPAAVDAWLDAVERRQRAGASTASDGRALAAVERRVIALRDRAESKR